ncbi:MAG: CehA/McbA family metallohydrolase [Pirellulaceae bacterium]|nr:CehA/McbA family metallohydrolase [Pirellulaceae bacterium]
MRNPFWIALLICVLFCGSATFATDPPIVSVEAQPLASNARRVIAALDLMGYPLTKDLQGELNRQIDREDADGIQRVMDREVLAVVQISPEERVSVTRAGAKTTLQQAGYRPVIIKVINHSTSTARLNVTSPQSGPLYAGTAQLSMQRQQQMHLLANQNNNGSTERFLAIEVHRKPPMTAELSGLEVEYVIVLLASNDAGRREAVLHFDIGDQTADLEHRNELPVLFEALPAVPLKLSITDHDGEPTIARLEFRDHHNRVYPLQAKRVAPDFFFQAHVYRNDGETVLLPPGTLDVQYSRGPEYHVRTTQVEIDPNGDNELAVKLDRWYDAGQYGFFSGDHHIHAAGCAHYTHPTEGVSPADMFRQVHGEGLNVGCVLTWGPCFDFQRQYFNKAAQTFGTNDTLLKYDLEISGFGSQALGHVCLLNLNDQTYPESDGSKSKGWPTWTTPVMRWAKQQGGYAGYAHSASGLQIHPEAASERLMERLDVNDDGSINQIEAAGALLPMAFAKSDTDDDGRLSAGELQQAHRAAAEQLPNYAIPEMNGVGAMEICVSTVAGVCDFISAMDTRRIQEWNTWYHLLNCGFPLKVSGETDFPCMSSRRVGQGRVYVHLGLDAELDFQQWCEGLAKGRSYVSDGYAHLAAMTVDGVAPGYGDVSIEGPGRVTISGSVAFAPATPEGVAYGTQSASSGRAVIGDTVVLHRDRSDKFVRGGTRELEIIVNSEVVATQIVPADGSIHEFQHEISIDKSSWVAVRQFPQLHSNPVNVNVDGKPIRASRRSAHWCVEMTQLLWENRQQRIADHERGEAREAFDHAIKTLLEIASESPPIDR